MASPVARPSILDKQEETIKSLKAILSLKVASEEERRTYYDADIPTN